MKHDHVLNYSPLCFEDAIICILCFKRDLEIGWVKKVHRMWLIGTLGQKCFISNPSGN